MTTTTAPSLRWRTHWVIAELDARGEIDAHAAMCLRHAIEATRASTTEVVLVDLRDLTAISPAGLELFTIHNADCDARGMSLGLLISGHERHDEIAEAFALAGLTDALCYEIDTGQPATGHSVSQHDGARTVLRGSLARATRRVWPRPLAPGKDDATAATADSSPPTRSPAATARRSASGSSRR